MERLSTLHVRPAVWSAQAVVVRLALLVGVAWTVFLLATFGSVLAAIDWNADVASTLTIGEFFPRVPDGATVTLASYPWYATLWFELLTRHLPFHREIWEVAPWIASLAAVGLLTWATAKVAGRWAAAVVALLLVCAGRNLLLVQFAPSEHGSVVWYACLLDAFLVLLVMRGGRVGSWAAHAALTALVAAVVAVGLASDKLVYLGGLAPFLLAGLVVARLARNGFGARVLATTLAVTAGAVIGSRVVISAMKARHVVAGNFPITLTSTGRLGHNLLEGLQSLFALFNGTFDNSPVSARSLLALACAGLVLVALVATMRLAARWLSELGEGLAGHRADGPAALLRTVHLSFWIAAAILTALAYEVTTVPEPNTGRYLLATAYGIVVVLVVAVAASGPARLAIVTLGASVIAFASVVSLAEDFDPSTGDQMAGQLLPFLQGEGLTYGYGAYWVAVPLTWKSHLRAQIAPIVSCPKAPHGLCAYYNHTISSWYRPRPNVRSFLIVDRRYGPPPPGKRLGGTVEVLDFTHFSVYVYDYDIGANIATDWWRYVPSDVVPQAQ